MAAADIARGALTPAQVERLKNTVKELVHDLEGYDDITPPAGAKDETVAGPTADQRALPKTQPPPSEASDAPVGLEWRSPTPVLCVAGRGPLDEAASSMLTQLLAKHGLGARLAAHGEVSRSSIRFLDLRGIQMICVSYLDISGNPAHLRYLLRRLRDRQPQARLLVGLWPAEDPVLRDQGLRHMVGADDYVSSLHAAVEACLAAAHQSTEEKPRVLTPAE